VGFEGVNNSAVNYRVLTLGDFRILGTLNAER
jgi:hypothetical protein